MDDRIKKHAEILVNWSVDLKENENVLIQASSEAEELVTALYKEIAERNANPVTLQSNEEAQRNYLNNKEEFQVPGHLKSLYEETDAIINIKSSGNQRALNNVSSHKLTNYSKSMKPIQEIVEEKTWVLTQHPTKSQAQLAEMSLKEYRDFVYNSILIDWEDVHDKQQKLVKKLKEGKKVQITGPKTDLSMNIEGSSPQNSDGKKNMPSGEVFTAPKPNSAEGRIYFDLPIIYQGKEITDVELTFEEGKITDYRADKGQKYLKEIIEADEGSNKIGELGIGTNRGINQFTKNILFDEKIGDTIHLALGRAIKESVGDNERNNSAIHIDMIKNMEDGAIKLDEEEIYSNGEFFWEKNMS